MYMGRLVYERVGILLFEVNEKPGRFWSVNTVKGLNRVELIEIELFIKMLF